MAGCKDTKMNSYILVILLEEIGYIDSISGDKKEYQSIRYSQDWSLKYWKVINWNAHYQPLCLLHERLDTTVKF